MCESAGWPIMDEHARGLKPHRLPHISCMNYQHKRKEVTSPDRFYDSTARAVHPPASTVSADSPPVGYPARLGTRARLGPFLTGQLTVSARPPTTHGDPNAGTGADRLTSHAARPAPPAEPAASDVTRLDGRQLAPDRLPRAGVGRKGHREFMPGSKGL